MRHLDPKITSLVVFVVLFLLSLDHAHVSFQREQAELRQNHRALADSLAMTLQARLDHSHAAADSLAALLPEDGRSREAFQDVADDLLRSRSADVCFLAPDGVVKTVWPASEKGFPLGRDLAVEPETQAEVRRAMETRSPTLVGPFPLENGEQAVLFCHPLLSKSAGVESVWGLAGSLLRLSSLFGSTHLAMISGEGHMVELRRILPGTGHSVLAFQSGPASPDMTESAVALVEALSGVWTVTLAHGPERPPALAYAARLGIGLAISLAGAGLVWTVLRQRQAALAQAEELGRLNTELGKEVERRQDELRARTKTEEALLATRRRLNHLLRFSPAVLFGLEATAPDRATYVSGNIQDLLGYSPNEIVGRPGFIGAGLHPEDAGMTCAALTALEERGRASLECRFRRKDGTHVWIRGDLRLIRDRRGRPREIVGSVYDATEPHMADEALRCSLREKEALLREIHHRVKNNLQIVSSLISLQAARLRQEESRSVFRQMNGRIRSMSLVHEQLYQSSSFSRISLRDYVSRLCDNLSDIYFKEAGRVALVVKAEEVFLPLEGTAPLGLILCELITNSLRHAFPDGRSGTILVSLTQTGPDEAELRVKDDGVGLPDAPPPDAKGLGLQLTQSLAEQVSGRLDIRSEGGLDVRLRFPLRGPEEGEAEADGAETAPLPAEPADKVA